MDAMPHRLGWFWLGLLATLGASGCVERRMVIITDPYGAIVYDERNRPIGAAPADHSFTYYGTYKFRLAKDGYETLVVEEKIRAPWYERFGIDFISENLIPWTIRDVRYFRYVMQPVQVVPPEQLMQQAEALRAYGQTIGTPLPTTPPVLMPPPAP